MVSLAATGTEYRSLRLPCVLMHGGASRGPFFLASDLPSDIAARDAVLLTAMGPVMSFRSMALAEEIR